MSTDVKRCSKCNHYPCDDSDAMSLKENAESCLLFEFRKSEVKQYQIVDTDGDFIGYIKLEYSGDAFGYYITDNMESKLSTAHDIPKCFLNVPESIDQIKNTIVDKLKISSPIAALQLETIKSELLEDNWYSSRNGKGYIKHTEQVENNIYSDLFDENNGKYTLNHIAVAEMLESKYHVVAYRESLYVYDDGVYIGGEEILQTEIVNISKHIGCKGSIKKPTSEILHILKFSSPNRDYPFNVSDAVVNVDNGVVVIDFENETFELVKHDPKFRFNYKFDVKFNPDNTTDTIHTQAIMKYVESNDVELLYQIPAQAILQMMGSDPFKKAYLIQGDMDAGKSAYLQILLRMFGESTHSQVSLQALGNNRFALAELEGKIFNVYDDLSNIPLNDAGVFKTLTGKREQRIERKHNDGYNAILSAVHVYTCNKPPEFDTHMQNDTAFWGRWEYVRFPNHFDRDAFFYDRVFTPENMECMFIKTLEHVVKIRKEGLQVNSTPNEVREKWSFNSDPLYQFIMENMELSEREITLNKNDFLEAYTRWCTSTDVDQGHIIRGQNGFTTALFKYGFISRQLTANNVRSVYYQGAYKWREGSEFATESLKTKTVQANVM